MVGRYVSPGTETAGRRDLRAGQTSIRRAGGPRRRDGGPASPPRARPPRAVSPRPAPRQVRGGAVAVEIEHRVADHVVGAALAPRQRFGHELGDGRRSRGPADGPEQHLAVVGEQLSVPFEVAVVEGEPVVDEQLTNGFEVLEPLEPGQDIVRLLGHDGRTYTAGP